MRHTNSVNAENNGGVQNVPDVYNKLKSINITCMATPSLKHPAIYGHE